MPTAKLRQRATSPLTASGAAGAVIHWPAGTCTKMALDPQIQDILESVRRAARPAFWQMTPDAARHAYRRAAPVLEIAPASLGRIDDFSIRTRTGSSLAVRLYVPAHTSNHDALVVYFHGGGFTVGDLDTHDRVCRMLAAGTPCRVLAVDYRLAPEHRFPAAADDAWEALFWAHGNARRLGADPHRIAVAGDSAGGTLAAVCAIRARDAGLALRLQVLIYPGTAGYQDSASHQRLAEGYLLDAPTIQWFFGQYLRDEHDRRDWRFAPLDAEPAPDLGDVAPACILVAGYDPLHDEGVAYAERLRAAGVRVELRDYEGMVHGFFNFGGAVEVARTAHRDVLKALAAALGLPGERLNGEP
jgi:acetyl esterase